MKNKDREAPGCLILTLILVLCFYGWGANIIKLANLDFASPYKAEVFRGVGIPVWPVGIVLGFVNFEEEQKQ